jgi:7-carboxy-7-deazaguanine synthase
LSINTNTAMMYPVMEAFYTIQGEGFYQGHAAYFIRLGGCDVGCHWCDVKESWDADAHERLSVTQIVNDALAYEGRLVVITGGEPCMHNLEPLTTELHNAGFTINIETSGAHQITGAFDWICLSPKKFKAPLPQACEMANELKVIIFNKSDFDWAEQYAAQVNDKCQLYLQPEWEKMDSMIDGIVSYIQQNPKWQLSVQIHKWIGVN